MKRIVLFLFCISISFSSLAQDNCVNATTLCANNSISSTTAGATTVGSDPALACGDMVVNNSVWFKVEAINNGNATVTVSNINNNPGLEMEVYTGVCGSFTAVGACATANAPASSMNVNFPTIAGTTYYIMVDGASGNQEAFNINATTSDDALLARPDADFITNPTIGCIPLSVLLDSTTTLHGGTNITFQWKIDGGSYFPASGSDTTIVLNTLGNHTVNLRVCNSECGCKSVSQDIFVQDITTSIDFSPAINCINSAVSFSGGAQMTPDTTISPNVTNWTWNFGDPNSGVSNTATGQFPSHSFVGPGASFTVQLIVDGTCGPDTITTVVNMSPSPVVSAGLDQSICEGSTAILFATVISGTLPIASYNWVGPGTIGCTGCDTTTVDDLPAGGPYLFSLDIVDANGCTADTTVNILVNAKPTVDGGTDQTTCANQPVNLFATPLSGNPPFAYAWDPSTGLNDSTLQNPISTVSVFTSYCISITDLTGCVSDAACINIDVYPAPVITPTTPVLCASNPNLTDTFDVVGAGAGSTYSWTLSPDYALITGAAVDSSSIYVAFPPGIAGNYTFIAIVTDGITGCTDTVPITFSVTNGISMIVTGAPAICDGETTTLLASGAVTYAWTANPPYVFTDSTLASQDVSPTVTTVFTIYGAAGTCSQIITDTLVVNPNPVAIPAAISNFCGCETVTLDGTASTPGMIYLWTSSGGATISNQNAISTTSTICSSDVFTLTVTDSVTGCTANDITGANSFPKPDAAALVSPVLICPAAPTLITLDGTGSDVAGGTTYAWTSNDPSVVISNPAALVTDATVSGATIFYLTVTDLAGCDSIASDTVFAFTTPLVTAGPDQSICEGSTANLAATVLSGTLPIASYNWVGPGTIGCTGCQTTTVDDLPAGGPYLFSLDIVDANGCADDTTINITVNSKPTVDGGTDQITCANQPVNLFATPLSGNPPFAYTWDPSTGLNDSTLQSPISTVSVLTSYCVFITDLTGCVSDAACINIDVYPPPVITPTISVLCATNPNLTDTFDVVGAGAGSTYSWVLSPDYPLIAGASIDSASIYVTFPAGIAASYTFIAIVTDGITGCTDTVPVTFSVTSGLNMLVTGPSQICIGATGNLLASGAITYAWTANPPYAFADSTLASQNVTPAVTTVFTIYGTAGTCSSIITDTLIVNSLPIADVANIPDFCGCATITLDGSGSTPGINYLWTSTGGAAIANPTAISTTSTSCTSDVFTITVTNPLTGCTANDFTGANSLIKPDGAAVVSPVLICPDSPTLIALDGTGSDAAIGTTYLWTSNDPSVVISNPTALMTDATVSGATIFYLTVTDLAGCDSIASDTVYTFTTPIVTAGPDRSTCEGTTALLIATVLSGTLPIASFNWVGPGTIGCTGCDTTTVDDLPPGGPYLFSLDIVDANGCADDTTINITVNSKPTVDGGTDQITCANQPVNLLATPLTGNPPFNYAWDPSTGLNDSTLQNPIARVSVLTSYCIAITDFTGCVSDAACINIDVYPAPTITPTIPLLCASNPNLIDTFVVAGAGAGSIYSWVLSPDFSLITGAAIDSSSIQVTFPSGVVASYTFIAIVTDGVTGCTDTVPVTFSVANGINMSVTGPSEICNGATATILASGAISYAWTANPPYSFTDSTMDSQDVSPAVTTVFTIYGTAGTCAQLITDTLIVNPNPVATVANIPDFCGCATVTLNGTGSTPGMNYLWTSLGGAIIASTTALNTNSSICASETFDLTVTDPVTGCFASNNAATNSIPKPDAVAFVSPVIICPGISNVITLDGTGSEVAGGTTYLWTSNDPSVVIATPTLLVTTATVSSATIFYLTVTNATSCDSMASDTVDVFPPPVFTASPAFLCTADPLQQSTLSITGEGVGSTYSWDVVPACAIPNSANTASQLFDFSVCGVGIYNFNVSITDGVTGCVDTVTQTVTVVSGVALVVSSDTTICEGSSITLSASGANSFLWNTLDTTSSITRDSLTVAGSPYVLVVTGTIGSCTAVDSVTVTVNPVPVTSAITGTDTVCENDPGVIYSVTPAIGNYTWTVVGGAISSGQGTDTISVDWGLSGNGTVSVVDTNAFGCSGVPQLFSVTINPVPVTSPITGPDTVCENRLTSYFIVPNAGSVYSWMATGGSIIGSSTASFVSVVWSPAGSGSISVQESNAVGCSSAGQMLTVEINPQPLPVAIAGNNVLCESDTMQVYSTIANPGSAYDWTVTGGAIVSGQGTDSILVNWGSPGTGIVAATEINSFGCSSDTSFFNVSLNALPVATASPDSASVCQNNVLSISGTVNIGSVLWTTSGSGTFNDSSLVSPDYNAGAIDSGYITLTMVVSNPPCQNDTEIVILYVSEIPSARISATQSNVCDGDSTTLSADTGFIYSWMPGGDTTSSITIYPTMTKTYVLTVTNALGCSSTDSILITLIPHGIPTATGDTLICFGDSAQLTGTFQDAGGLNWSSLGDGTFFPDTSSLVVSYVPGPNDSISGGIDILLITTGACFNETDTLQVSISQFPSVSAGNDQDIMTGSSSPAPIQLNGSFSSAIGATWTSTGTGSFAPDDSVLNATYIASTQDYTLDSIVIALTTYGGCRVIHDDMVLYFESFSFPNVITPYPGSPGENDFFRIDNLAPNSQLKIWDRWGTLVFVTDYYLNDWDAAELKADTYYYYLFTEGKEYKGWIKVIREK